MNALKNNRGISVAAVVIMMLIMAVMGAVLVSLVTTESSTSIRQMRASQAQYVAEGGMEYALYQFKTGIPCASLSYNNISLGTGTFTTTGTRYNPASTALSGAINNSVTTITVASTAGYASSGRILIDSELLDYSGVSGNSFTGARRGVAGTTAAAHSSGAAVRQNECLVQSSGTVAGSSGNSQRIVTAGIGSAAYLYGRTVTIDHTKVPNTNQSNFPMLFSGTYSYLATVANGGGVTNSSGFDIIFTSDAAGTTKLDHEIESYNPTTGAVNFWVRVPTVSTTTDTVIYLWYGNSSITTSQENMNGVWDTSFKGVWHLDEIGNGTANEFKDSTSNANHGQGGLGVAAKVPAQTTGEIGFGQNFNGNVFIGRNGATGLPAINGTQTISGWYKVTTNPTTFRNLFAVETSPTGSANQAMLGTSAAGAVGMTQWGAAVTISTPALAAGVFRYFVWTRDATTNRIYLDGTQQTTSGTALQTGAAVGIRFGTYNEVPNEALVGQLDEVRISNATRSADWIRTEYNNQSSPSTFYTVGFAIVALIDWQEVFP